MSGTALIVIDVQAALFDPVPRPHEADAVLARIHHLARAARVAGVPVVWVQHEDPREGHALAHGSPGRAVHPAAGPDTADAFNRKTGPIEVVYFQCARALLRSQLWNPATWPDRASLPTAATQGSFDGAANDAALPQRQRDTLY